MTRFCRTPPGDLDPQLVPVLNISVGSLGHSRYPESSMDVATSSDSRCRSSPIPQS